MKPADYFISIGNATDVGKVRELNEDYLAHFDTPLGYCIIICDGMGGHTGGQVAAQTAALAIQKYLQDSQIDATGTPVTLSNAFEFANFQIRKLIGEKPSLNGMGTTCVLALIENGKLFTAHAGDSRIYLIRKNKILQITRDHSSVQQLIDEGVMTEEEAGASDKKNQIIKAIGVFEKVQPTISENPITLSKDDKILLCSDGLTEHLTAATIFTIVEKIQNIQEASLELIHSANRNGGTDNITVQMIHYTGNHL